MKILPSTVIVLALSAAGPALAADPAAGEALHDKHCMTCHKSLTGGDPNSLYTRADRRVSSLEGLHKQVRRCELSLGLRWFDEQIADVAAYLNQSFYHFEE